MWSPNRRRALAARAMTIYERAAHVRQSAQALPDGIDPGALKILNTWNQAFAPGDRDAFLRRLSWDGLDSDLVAAAAADPDPETVDAGWADWLAGLDTAADDVLREMVNAGGVAEADYFAGQTEPPYVECWTPILRAARRELADALATDVLTAEARIALDRQLLRELAVYGALAAHEQFGAFRRTSDAEAPLDAASRALYRQFIVQTVNDRLGALFTSYPVLARQLVTVARCWAEATRELVERVVRDQDALAATFNGGRALGRVVGVEPGLSDPHEGRRRVAILTFEAGVKVVYKPRDLSVDGAFAQLLAWFERQGLDPAPAAPRVLQRPHYGWVEFVDEEMFPDRESVGRYFAQAGALLFITHCLGSRDLHMENVMATRSGPAVIDLEMLLQPVSHAAPAPTVDGDSARPSIAAESCLRTGLLTLVELGPGDVPYDMGGLRGTGTTATTTERVWANLGTDAVACADHPMQPAVVRNAVRTSEGVQRPEDYRSEIVGGFERAYDLALARRAELLAPDGPLAPFAGTEVRVIVRPTNQYGLLSATRNLPRYQRDAVTHSIVVDALHRPLKDSRERPREWALAVEERRATDALDVPRFVVPSDGLTLYSDGQPILCDYFAVSPLGAVRDRVARLSEADRQAQLRALARAVRQSTTSRFLLPPPRTAPQDQQGAAADAGLDLMAHARWVGNELLAHAASGIADRPAGRRPERLIWDAREDLHRGDAHYLYDGSIGPGVFLAGLASLTGDAEWRSSALASLGPALEWIEGPAFAADAVDAPIGGCSGLGSIVHGLARAGTFLGDERLLAAAARVAAAIDPARIAADRFFDIVDGAAGALLSLLVLHEIRPDERLLDSAVRCGEHLVASRVERGDRWGWPSPGGQLLVGYAHGAAGIAAALTRLSEATGNPSYRDAATRALDFACALFSPADRNWPIAEPDPGNIATIMGKMNAWCHGAPGIIVAAAAAARGGAEPAIVAQARAALATLERWNPVQPDHMCCGHLGRSDAYLTGAGPLGVDDALQGARAIAARALGRARERQHFRLSTPGVEYIVFGAGFFRGLSGIGYQLLRLAEPARVPSILFFGAAGAA